MISKTSGLVSDCAMSALLGMLDHILFLHYYLDMERPSLNRRVQLFYYFIRETALRSVFSGQSSRREKLLGELLNLCF